MAAVERSGDVYFITLTEEDAEALANRWSATSHDCWTDCYSKTLQAIADGLRACQPPPPPQRKVATHMHARRDADVCRENGWGPGTLLVGDEGYGPTTILITRVGTDRIAAKAVMQNGIPIPDAGGRESSWVLWCRDWHEVARDVRVGDGA